MTCLQSQHNRDLERDAVTEQQPGREAAERQEESTEEAGAACTSAIPDGKINRIISLNCLRSDVASSSLSYDYDFEVGITRNGNWQNKMENIAVPLERSPKETI